MPTACPNVQWAQYAWVRHAIFEKLIEQAKHTVVVHHIVTPLVPAASKVSLIVKQRDPRQPLYLRG